VQRRQGAAQGLVVPGGPGRLVDRGGDEQVGFDEHHVRHRRRPADVAELVQAGGLVEGTGTDLGDELAPARLDHPGGATERSGRLDRTHGAGEAAEDARRWPRVSHALTLPSACRRVPIPHAMMVR
jgi:hypothetical protein